MGSISRRLSVLEDLTRERAAVEISKAWEALSDEEMALVLAPHHFGREPTLKETAAAEALQEVVPESLIEYALGYSEDLTSGELSRRFRKIIDPILQLRRSRLLQQFKTLEES